jgi:hypothetical protein
LTRWEGKADATGRCEVKAFYGQHRVQSDGKKAVVTLPKRKRTASVKLH